MNITQKTFRVAPDKAQIQTLYRTAFPKEEQLPWWVLRLAAASGRSELTAYYADGRFCAMTFSATAGDVFYVMFFAVEESLRGQGYGSAVLAHLKQTNPDKTILLNVEIPEAAAPNYAQRLQRMAFYRKNGFVDSGYNIREVGGVFRILSSTGKMDAEAYQKVFLKLSYGLWRPPITKAEENAQ